MEKKDRLRQIGQASARALLTAELMNQHWPFAFEWQKIQVKVFIRLNRRSIVSFTLRYSSVADGSMQTRIEKALSIIQAIEESGTDIRIKATGPMSFHTPEWTMPEDNIIDE